jgi:hypothetical protein
MAKTSSPDGDSFTVEEAMPTVEETMARLDTAIDDYEWAFLVAQDWLADLELGQL